MARRSKKSMQEILGSHNFVSFNHKEAELDRKIALATEGFTTNKYCELVLRDRARLSEENALTIIYARRHSGLTEKSRKLKDSLILRQYAGWSPRSNMPQKYVHYFGSESSESLLEAYGIVNRDNSSVDLLSPKTCPNCNEGNTADAKFCVKCRIVLTYDAYNETLQQQQEKELEIQRLQEKYELDMKAIRDEVRIGIQLRKASEDTLTAGLEAIEQLIRLNELSHSVNDCEGYSESKERLYQAISRYRKLLD